MQPPESWPTLRGLLGQHATAGRALYGENLIIRLAELDATRTINRISASLGGRSVLLAVSDQLTAAIALIALDGLAARIVVCPPGVTAEHRVAIADKAQVDIVLDDAWLARGHADEGRGLSSNTSTEWLLLTSGTTGVPKLVSHTLAGLTGAIQPVNTATSAPPLWATLYDIRRYGGLQIFLRAIAGHGSMVLPGHDEPLSRVLVRYGARGVTHISGTPSHWRRVLMDPAAEAIAPAYVRLSGEIADQAILDALQSKYPAAKVGHAYASTEAGVGFEVNDGREGFPASFVTDGVGSVAMKVENETLRIRSPRTAQNYVGETIALCDGDGFVDTGDLVRREGDRYHFAGRRGGIINIGGQKVHPEEVEAVINKHHAVRMSLVRSRKNPIVGAIVVADVVLGDGPASDCDALRREIQESCRETLQAWKVPATIRFVPALAVTAAGKLSRNA